MFQEDFSSLLAERQASYILNEKRPQLLDILLMKELSSLVQVQDGHI
jgi:hypothetical protein